MFLPSEQVPAPPTSPKRLFSRQVVSQTLPPKAWASSEIAAVTLGVILGVIILIALGYLANHTLKLLKRNIEQSVFERVQEHIASAQERRNAAFGIGDSQERGPSGRYLPPLSQQIGCRASPSLSRETDIERFPDHQVHRPSLRNHDQRETSPLDVGQISQRPDSLYRDPGPHPTTVYQQARSPSLARRRERERDTEAPVNAPGLELPRPGDTQFASPPQPSSRGREQSRRNIEAAGQICRTHSPCQSSLPPRQPWNGEGVRYVKPFAISVNNSSQGNEHDLAGPEYWER